MNNSTRENATHASTGPVTVSAAATLPEADLPLAILRRFAGVVLSVYWLTLFTATHIPIAETPVEFRGADKIAHFAGYGTLGLLLAFWVALKRPLSTVVSLTLVLLLAVYALFDEILQMPVGRTCDVRDWACDVCGALLGVACVSLMSRLNPRFR